MKTIKDYLLKTFSIDNVELLSKISSEIIKSGPDLELRKIKIKEIQNELDEMFLETMGTAEKFSSTINVLLINILKEIEKVDYGFLNRKIPPHIRK